ncbi:hypothetical protein F4861DRAFT_542359 [Xylaria intraflava]|nr:hypothetical protein F4861DRAFT_542359 [Xylaria intraflava]
MVASDIAADPPGDDRLGDQTTREVVRDKYFVLRRRYTAMPTAPPLAPLLDQPALCNFSLPTGTSSANENLKAALQQVSGLTWKQMFALHWQQQALERLFARLQVTTNATITATVTDFISRLSDEVIKTFYGS